MSDNPIPEPVRLPVELLAELHKLVGGPVLVTVESRHGPQVVLRGHIDRVETRDEKVALVHLDDQPQGTKVILVAEHLRRIEIDPFEPRDLRIELHGGLVVIRDTSPHARLEHWKLQIEAARHAEGFQERVGRLRLLAALIESDIEGCEDETVRDALHLLLAETRKLIEVNGWFLPREEPPEVEDLDDPDWEW